MQSEIPKYINKFNNKKIYYVLVNDFKDTFAGLNEIDDLIVAYFYEGECIVEIYYK